MMHKRKNGRKCSRTFERKVEMANSMGLMHGSVLGTSSVHLFFGFCAYVFPVSP